MNAFVSIVFSVLLALVYVYLQYFFRKPNYSRKSLILALLRFTVILTTCLICFYPERFTSIPTIKKPNLYVLTDNTESIHYFKQSKSVRSFIDSIFNAPEIKKTFDIYPYTFGRTISTDTVLKFDKKVTDIYSSLETLKNIHHSDLGHKNILLLTDGISTLGRDYTYLGRQYPIPIFTKVFGDTLSYPDLKISKLNASKYAFLGDESEIELVLNYTGNEQIKNRLTIANQDKVIYSEDIELDANNTSLVLYPFMKMDKVGVQTFTVNLSPLDKEKNTYNNRKEFVIEVLDKNLEVAIISDIVHPDIASLKRSLGAERQNHIRILNSDVQISELSKTDLIILYQPNMGFKKIYDYINKNRINHILIVGQHTDWKMLNANQNMFRFNMSKQLIEVQPILNETYTEFMTDGIDLDRYPPVKMPYGKINILYDYHLLLSERKNNLDTDVPLWLTLEKDNQRIAMISGTGFWKWRMFNYFKDKSFKSFDKLIQKMSYYLVANPTKKRLNVEAKRLYNLGEVNINAQYFNKDFELDSKAQLEISLIKTDGGKTRTLPMIFSKGFHYIRLKDLEVGNYNFEVRVLGTNQRAEGSFKIMDYNLETQFTMADLPKLKTISEQTGGNIVNNLTDFIEKHQEKHSNSPKEYMSMVHHSMRDNFWSFVVVIFCLSLEWLLRKREGLL